MEYGVISAIIGAALIILILGLASFFLIDELKINKDVLAKSQCVADISQNNWREDYPIPSQQEIDGYLACEYADSRYKQQCFYDFYQKYSENPRVCDFSNSKTTCYVSSAIQSKDIRPCYEAGSGKDGDDYGRISKESCISSLAYVEENETMCDCISTDNASEIYREYCHAKLINLTKDPNHCASLPEDIPRGICYQELAYDTNNKSYCAYIVNTNESEFLYYYFGSDMCYNKFVDNTNNASYCDYIQNVGARDQCYSDLAFATKNSATCYNMSETSGKYMCILRNSDVSQISDDFCKSMPKGEYGFDSDDCFYYLAIGKHNASICTMRNASESDICIRDVATYFHNTSICEFMSDQSGRDVCYDSFSNWEEKGSHLAFDDCNTLRSDGYRDRCLFNLNYYTGNATLCTLIKDSYFKSICETRGTGT